MPQRALGPALVLLGNVGYSFLDGLYSFGHSADLWVVGRWWPGVVEYIGLLQ